MSSFLVASGPFVFLVLILGIAALAAAVGYLTTLRRGPMLLAVGGAAAALIVGALATITGFQKSASHLRELAPDERWIVFQGLNESANNLVIALVAALLVCLILTAGAYRAAGR